MTNYEDRDHGDPFDLPAALEVLHRIAKPLRGGRAQEVGKRLYGDVHATSLHDARVKADALIARREAEEQGT